MRLVLRLMRLMGYLRSLQSLISKSAICNLRCRDLSRSPFPKSCFVLFCFLPVVPLGTWYMIYIYICISIHNNRVVRFNCLHDGLIVATITEDPFAYALSSNSAWAGYKGHQNPEFFSRLASGQSPDIRMFRSVSLPCLFVFAVCFVFFDFLSHNCLRLSRLACW